jgi:hypothetical protein
MNVLLAVPSTFRAGDVMRGRVMKTGRESSPPFPRHASAASNLLLLSVPVLSLLATILFSHLDAPGPVPTDLCHCGPSCEVERSYTGMALRVITPHGSGDGGKVARRPGPKPLTKRGPEGYT